MIDDAEMLTAVHILFLVESRGISVNWDSLVAGPLTLIGLSIMPLAVLYPL